MVLPSRRVVASIRRSRATRSSSNGGNQPCGLLIPSANLPPRPIYLASSQQISGRDSTASSIQCYSSYTNVDRIDISAERTHWPTPAGENGWKLVAEARCFGCGKPGHRIKECPEGDNKKIDWRGPEYRVDQSVNREEWKTRAGTNGWTLLAEGKCFICGEAGHKSKKCPQRPKDIPIHSKDAGSGLSGRKKKGRKGKTELLSTKAAPIYREPGDPSPEEVLSWPKEDKDDIAIANEFNKLPEDAKRRLKTPDWWGAEEITAENMMRSISLSEEDLTRLSRGQNLKSDVQKKKHGAVEPIKKEDVDPSELEGMADIRKVNRQIRDERFTEEELRDIMEDENEPTNDNDLWRKIIEMTEKDMEQDVIRLRRHEEETLKKQIDLRVAQGLSREEAEHDARYIMRLPQKQTETRKMLTRDLSAEAIEITELMSNAELEKLGDAGKLKLMKKLDKDYEDSLIPKKPSDEEGMDMYPIPPPKMESRLDPMHWEWNATDISSMAHEELMEHREARHYARLAVWDMPRLIKYVKPFQVPTSDEVLRFRYTTYMGADHPGEAKVVMECSPSDFGLTEIERNKLIKLCGARYNPTKNIFKFSCEMFPHQHQNKRYLSELIDKLIDEAKDTEDTFEDVPFDFRHHKPKPVQKFPKEWRMRPHKLQMKRLKDWEKLASPEELDRLRDYVNQKLSVAEAAGEGRGSAELL